MKTILTKSTSNIKSAMLALGICAAAVTGHAQNNGKQNSVINTPVLKFDNVEYKRKWILENPETYKGMGGTLDSDQQKQTLSTPQNSNDAPKKAIIILPDVPDFPKYEQTGNAIIDNENYRAKKQAWINSHPEEYNQLNQINNSDGKKRVKPANNQ
jgi:hypothetical protein